MEHVKVITNSRNRTSQMLVCCLIDINECETNNVCQHKCANRKGNFVCKCFKGYQLMDDGRSCKGKE